MSEADARVTETAEALIEQDRAARAEVDRLAARVRELERALRPFASVDFDADEDADDAITRADFRAARAALAKAGGTDA